MNILASYNWIKEYVKTNLPPEEFAACLSLSGPGIERIHPQGENLDKIVVGEIVKVKSHPNADKLRIAETKIGNRIATIVCGGSNLREGMLVAVALEGARVRWHGEGELVELKPTEICGIKSEGMICAANEIGLFDYFPHADREILDLTLILYSIKVEAGRPLREVLGFDDVVFDIEVTTNRPDAFSITGLAREASVILAAPLILKAPSTKHQTTNKSQIPKSKIQNLEIKIEAPKLCARYQAVVLKNVHVAPSPWWMQRRLIASGIRPISNIVDITNYVMLELGQPMHAFDADRLQTTDHRLQIAVRCAEKGERIKALDGNTYTLDTTMLVVADAKKPIAIAGVMGGDETGITKDTTTVIFEAATFDPVSVRRTARALNLHSDSSLRFEKGLSTESTTAAIARAVALAEEIAGAERASPILDRRVSPYRAVKFPWNPAQSEKLIGVKLGVPRMKKILESLGFSVRKKGKEYAVMVPPWRDHDIESSHDFAEEIARVYGYHKLPSLIPSGTLPLPPAPNELKWEDELREAFRGAGFTEVYSYSFVSEELLKKALISAPALNVQNPLTADFAVMRPSLIPSHLEIVAANEIQFPASEIFEVANVYIPRDGELPHEILIAGGALWGESAQGELFARAKGMIEALARRSNTLVDFHTDHSMSGVRGQMSDVTLGHPGRRVAIVIGGHDIGVIGEVHPLILEKFGIKRRVAIFSFDVNAFCGASQGLHYEPIPVFPPARRDISFVVQRKTLFEDVLHGIHHATPLLHDAELFDTYEGKGIADGKKSLALHLTFSDPARTLNGEEIEVAFARIVKELETKFHAEIRVA